MEEIKSTQDKDYTRAIELHAQIMANGQLAASALVAFARELKQMRDEKLYRQLGAESFGDYVRQMVGIEERQAYNYITGLERLGDDYMAANASLGITKLTMLSAISKPVRDQLAEENDLEDMTTRQVKDLIDQLSTKGKQLDLLQAENNDLRGQLEGSALSAGESDKDAEIERLKEQLENAVTEDELDRMLAKEKEKAEEEAKQQLENSIREKISAESEQAYAKREEAAKKEAAAKIKEDYKKRLEKADAEVTRLEAEKERIRKEEADRRAELEQRAQKLQKELSVAGDQDVTAATVLVGEYQEMGRKVSDKINTICQKNPDTGKKLAGAMVKLLSALSAQFERLTVDEIADAGEVIK